MNWEGANSKLVRQGAHELKASWGRSRGSARKAGKKNHNGNKKDKKVNDDDAKETPC